MNDTKHDGQLAGLLEEALNELRLRGDLDLEAWRSRYANQADDLVPLLQTLRCFHDTVTDCQKLAGATPTLHQNGPAGAPMGSDSLPDHGFPVQIGRYRILGKVGQGGMGTVYKAQDPQLERLVAIKVPRFDGPQEVRATAQQRFLRETRAAAAVRHANICPIHDVGEHNGIPYVVMGYVEGHSLEERIAKKNHQAVNSRQAAELVRRLALALAALHEEGIIHRDLKPSNVLLDAGGQPLLTDFGLARQDGGERLTVDGALVGTPAYMAPEQASLTGGKIGPWTDVYSLGVVLYRLVTGRTPFEGPALSVIYQVAEKAPPAPSVFRKSLDHRLETIILKAMAKRPEDRYASAGQFAEALRAWLQSAPAASPTPVAAKVGAGAPPPTWPWRRLVVVSAVLLIMLPLVYFFGGTVIRIATNKGELVIETDDPNVIVTVKGPSAIIYDKVRDRRFVLTAGDYEIEVREEGDGGLRFATKKFTIIRGGKETFQARLQIDPALVKATDIPQLLVVSKRTGNAEIFLVNVDGTGAKNLTQSKSENGNPAWSPDGRKIAFASDRDGASNIYVMDASGGNVKQLTKGSALRVGPSWSPDGKRIALAGHDGSTPAIFVMDADGSNFKKVSDGGDAYDPAWSPDGKKILFASSRAGSGFQLYVMDVSGANVKKLSTVNNPFGYVYPAWSPDGKQIAWSDQVNMNLQIFVANADGTDAKQLTRTGVFNFSATWSPDGKRIAFLGSDGTRSGVCIMDTDGGNLRILVAEEPIGRLAWRPK